MTNQETCRCGHEKEEHYSKGCIGQKDINKPICPCKKFVPKNQSQEKISSNKTAFVITPDTLRGIFDTTDFSVLKGYHDYDIMSIIKVKKRIEEERQRLKAEVEKSFEILKDKILNKNAKHGNYSFGFDKYFQKMFIQIVDEEKKRLGI